ncbi:MAG: cobyric acid synthase, partial [Anaerovoracaceae bacterium]
MAKAIMIQGTTSNAGKSWVVAGLCRIFKQDGYKVAPFKSQNMALNSFITKDGLEMGRAQVVQAEAAGVEPSVLMNPILLKPTNDTSSQVIVNGEVWEDMSAKEYYQQKKVLVPQVKEAFDTLAAENDIIVIEGAGSPSEINLKENDIVNMYMAKLAKAPVLVVGDIDRGGVFASLVGTMVLFDQSEKDMVKGLLINKFRGDKTILEPGLDILSEKAGKPVLGVIPYLQVDIEDEDSLTERFHTKDEQAVIDLAVIRIPRISNFTDFNVFETIKGVGVRYVDKEMDFGNPDMVFIPGTKNTMEDLLWMRQNGIEGRIKQYAAQGNPVFGICGGYQMLGEQLKDPEGVEHGGTLDGIGLLPSVTTFEKQKI